MEEGDDSDKPTDDSANAVPSCSGINNSNSETYSDSDSVSSYEDVECSSDESESECWQPPEKRLKTIQAGLILSTSKAEWFLQSTSMKDYEDDAAICFTGAVQSVIHQVMQLSGAHALCTNMGQITTAHMLNAAVQLEFYDLLAAITGKPVKGDQKSLEGQAVGAENTESDVMGGEELESHAVGGPDPNSDVLGGAELESHAVGGPDPNSDVLGRAELKSQAASAQGQGAIEDMRQLLAKTKQLLQEMKNLIYSCKELLANPGSTGEYDTVEKQDGGEDTGMESD